MALSMQVKNGLVGAACLGGTVGVYYWSIAAVQQDDFMDLGENKVHVHESGLKVTNKEGPTGEKGCVHLYIVCEIRLLAIDSC